MPGAKFGGMGALAGVGNVWRTGLQKPFVCECFAGMGFQVFFKGNGLLFVLEGCVGNKAPWFVLRSMRGLPIVVGHETGLQVAAESDIGLVWVGNASEEIYIVHDSQFR